MIGPTTRQHAVLVDQRTHGVSGRLRPRLVVGIYDFDRPAENAAGRVDVLGGEIEPEPRLLAVELDTAGKRQHRADADRFAGFSGARRLKQRTAEQKRERRADDRA
ncbi:hypothetical protein ACVMB1_002120 [Bradyrhizobium sp. USDA 4504]